jgi:dTDP-4-dehydrorhamnose 3,5-epimerase
MTSTAIRLQSKMHTDERGQHQKFLGNEMGIDGFTAVESYMTVNNRNTLRGMHFQLPNPQGKLIRVITGSVLLNAVKIVDNAIAARRSGIFSAENLEQILVPGDWALGYRALEDDTRVLYLADNHFDPDGDNGLDPLDPALDLDWGIDPSNYSELILSKRDQNLPSLKDFRAKGN